MIGYSKAHKMAKHWFQNSNKGTSNQADPSGKRLGPELGYRYMDIVDYVLLPLILLFQMAFTLKILLVPFLVQYFHHNMFVVIGWEDYVI
jgi:hypothetical protein